MALTTYQAYAFQINNLVTNAITAAGKNTIGEMLKDIPAFINNTNVIWVKPLNADYNLAFEYFNHATTQNREKGIKGIIITVEEVALTRNHIKIIYDGRKSTSTAIVEIGGTTDVISLDIWINLIRDNIGSILNSISSIGPNAVMIPYGVETT